jgi:hypothetical protein
MKCLFSCVFLRTYWVHRAHVDDVGCPARCNNRYTYRRIDPRPPNRPTRQVGILSRENLRTARRRGQVRNRRYPPVVDPDRPEQLQAGELCDNDQLALVSEYVRLSDVYNARLVAATMGETVQYEHIHATADRPTGHDRAPFALWRRWRRAAPSVVD